MSMDELSRIKSLSKANLPQYSEEERAKLDKIEALKRMIETNPDVAEDIASKESGIMEMVDKSEKRDIIKDKLSGMMEDRREIEEGKNPVDIAAEMRRRRFKRMIK